MSEQYDDIYTDYSDKQFDYYYPISFDCRTKDYLQCNIHPDTTWYYGDSVTMTFNLLDEEESEEEADYLNNQYVWIFFSDFRGEVIFKKIYVPVNTEEIRRTVTLNLTAEESRDYFKRGTYYCCVRLANGDEDTATDIITVLPEDKYTIYVK